MTDSQTPPDGAEPRVAFGDQPNQTMPLSWASGMLRDLFASDRARFGRLLAGYVTGIEQPARGRKPAGAE